MFAPTTRAVGQGARLVFVLLSLCLLGGCVNGGLPGLPQDAERTVSIDITDRSFGPGPVAVQNGETVRFVVRNRTSRVYDFTIGMPHKQRLRSDRLLALAEAGVFESGRYDVPEYDAYNAVLVPPGATRVLVWWFDRLTGEAACVLWHRGGHGRRASFA